MCSLLCTALQRKLLSDKLETENQDTAMKLLVPSDSFVMPSFLPKSVMENVQTCVLPSDDNAFLVEPDISINSSNSVLLDDGYSSVLYDGNSQLNSTFDVQLMYRLWY